jgi:hypothetical protein
MKTNKEKTIKKLSLNKETLMNLSKANQSKVIGGYDPPKTSEGHGGSQSPQC